MANDSSTAGYLAPTGPTDAYDASLDASLQRMVVGITGIAGALVRPRWQPEPPKVPEYTVDWCALGVASTSADTFAYEEHVPDDNGGAGADAVERDEELEVLCSFYGPACASNAARLRDGLAVEQNRAQLRADGIVVTEVGRATQVPVLVTERWLRRVDVTITLRRRTRRLYKVLTVTSGQLGIDNEIYVTPIQVNNP